ncbi:MAG: hypothetical protein ACOCWQ_03805 [Nanoarchaeota archaeon]
MGHSLVQRIQEQYPHYQPIADKLQAAAYHLYHALDSLHHFAIFSHRADADGLTGECIPWVMLQTVAQAMGIPYNNDLDPYQDLGENGFDIASHRVMRIEEDPADDCSIPRLIEDFTLDDQRPTYYLFVDLAGARPAEVARHTAHAIILDHHISHPQAPGIHYINPNEHGFDGARELSGGVLSALLAHYLVDQYHQHQDAAESVREGLDQMLNVVTIFGLAGGNADQQGAKGLNKALYDHLLDQRIIREIPTPFFGFNSKPLAKVLAESNIPFNLKYQTVSPLALERELSSRFGRVNAEHMQEFYKEHKLLFAQKRTAADTPKGTRHPIGLNWQYLGAMTEQETEERVASINAAFHNLTGQDLLSVHHEMNPKTQKPFLEIDSPFDFVFENFTDDIRQHDLRATEAEVMLQRRDFPTKKTEGEEEVSTTLRDLQEMSIPQKCRDGRNTTYLDLFMRMYHQNLRAFSDSAKQDVFLELFDTPQFNIEHMYSPLLHQTSIGELANTLTAMSKTGFGDLLRRAALISADGTYEPTATFRVASAKGTQLQSHAALFGHISSVHQTYKMIIRASMEHMETLMQDDSKLDRLADGVYAVDVDSLAEAISSIEGLPIQTSIDLPLINGVIGGIAAQTRLLPGHYGILMTTCTQSATTAKVSYRINPFPHQAVHMGEFLSGLRKERIVKSGGGHATAAACTVSRQDLPTLYQRTTQEYANTREQP